MAVRHGCRQSGAGQSRRKHVVGAARLGGAGNPGCCQGACESSRPASVAGRQPRSTRRAPRTRSSSRVFLTSRRPIRRRPFKTFSAISRRVTRWIASSVATSVSARPTSRCGRPQLQCGQASRLRSPYLRRPRPAARRDFHEAVRAFRHRGRKPVAGNVACGGPGYQREIAKRDLRSRRSCAH
jgi:hypothetical protein